MKLLALDTATETCSAALSIAGDLRWRAAANARGHGEQVLAMIDELLAEAGLSLRALDAIAYGRGPGAFTGLRLAASITQGLAYSSGLPVLPVSDLRATAQQAFQQAAVPARVLVCQDARMGEVYWAVFEPEAGYARAATAESVGSPASVLAAAGAWLREGGTSMAGSGLGAYPELAAAAAGCNAAFPGLGPHAREIALLAAHDGLAAALPATQALPVYVRNNVAVAPAQS